MGDRVPAVLAVCMRAGRGAERGERAEHIGEAVEVSRVWFRADDEEELCPGATWRGVRDGGERLMGSPITCHLRRLLAGAMPSMGQGRG